MGRAARMAISSLYINRWSAAMPQPNDLSRSLVALDQNSTIIAVVEMSQSSWLVGGILPGIERQPRKKLEPSSERDPFRALREPDRRRRDEKRPFRSEQKTGNKPNNHLTEKLPYKSANFRFFSRRALQCIGGP